MRKRAVLTGGFLLAALTASVIWLFLAIRGEPLEPATPPLLVGLRAPGGNLASLCLPDERDLQALQAETGTVAQRLSARFPKGSPDTALVQYLQSQGFKLAPPCDNDPSVRGAIFRQSGGGIFGPYPAFAFIGWKLDADRRIVWIHGTVAYTGL